MSARRTNRQLAARMFASRLAATTLAATSICITLPAQANAAPALPALPMVPSPADLASLLNDAQSQSSVAAAASIAPAIIGAAAQSGVGTDAAQATTFVDFMRSLLHQSDMPTSTVNQLKMLIDFAQGTRNDSGLGVPDNVAVISNFLWPTLSFGCIDGGNSVGTAVAVPGPAVLPPPGPAAGQAGFVFTALGTPGLAEGVPAAMNVQFLNVANGRIGNVPLTNSANINPDGPATLSAVADTGRGPVLALVTGSLTVAGGRRCDFLPTLGFVNVQ